MGELGEMMNAERNTDEFFLKMHKEVMEMAKLTVEDVPSHFQVPLKDLLSLCEAQHRSLEHARGNFGILKSVLGRVFRHSFVCGV